MNMLWVWLTVWAMAAAPTPEPVMSIRVSGHDEFGERHNFYVDQITIVYRTAKPISDRYPDGWVDSLFTVTHGNVRLIARAAWQISPREETK